MPAKDCSNSCRMSLYSAPGFSSGSFSRSQSEDILERRGTVVPGTGGGRVAASVSWLTAAVALRGVSGGVGGARVEEAPESGGGTAHVDSFNGLMVPGGSGSMRL